MHPLLGFYAIWLKKSMKKYQKYIKKKKIVNTEKALGTYIGTNAEFGFVKLEDCEEEIFIPGKHTLGAMDSDTVAVEIYPGISGKNKKREGIVVKILKRGITSVVGTFEKSRNFGFVIPDNHKFPGDIFVPKEKWMGAVDGHKVVCEITEYPDGRKSAEGKITEILGHINEPGVDILSIVRALDIPETFPEKVLNQAAKIPPEISLADTEGREDLRDMVLVTIDGEDSKDLDDAVSLTVDGDCYELGVHIADVSNYVQEGSALDKQALKRGTSVYLCDRVIPMLPFSLSNGICSLNEGEDRLALSCFMRIDGKGEIVSHRLAESVIRSKHRMTYPSVLKILEGDTEERQKFEDVVPMLLEMQKLSGILRERRVKRGSIDFDLPECKIKVDEKGYPVKIEPYLANAATRLIEEFMLAANETVASHFYWEEVPFLYRVHETPDKEKIEKLSLFISNFGYVLKGTAKKEVHPKEIAGLLSKIEGTPEEAMISRMTLRSMQQAKYSVNCLGHFGLSCKYYCHFTSPIRRYPDLQIHRIIKDEIRGRLKEEKINAYKFRLPDVAEKTSKCERRAVEAERETNKLKKAQYMQKHLGEEFEGMVSGLSSWGIYVELPNTVEGMIRLNSLTDDFYNFDETTYQVEGVKHHKIYRLGDPIRVVCVSADEVYRTVGFDPAEK